MNSMEFYNTSDRICALIDEINRLTNSGEYYYKIGDYAPYIYTNGKCYYFALALKDLFPDGLLCMVKNRLHIIIKIDDDYYDAYGVICGPEEIEDMDPFIIDPHEDYYFLHNCVANDYDDKYLLPTLISIVHEADSNLKKRLNYVKKERKKERFI